MCCVVVESGHPGRFGQARYRHPTPRRGASAHCDDRARRRPESAASRTVSMNVCPPIVRGAPCLNAARARVRARWCDAGAGDSPGRTAFRFRVIEALQGAERSALARHDQRAPGRVGRQSAVVELAQFAGDVVGPVARRLDRCRGSATSGRHSFEGQASVRRPRPTGGVLAACHDEATPARAQPCPSRAFDRFVSSPRFQYFLCRAANHHIKKKKGIAAGGKASSIRSALADAGVARHHDASSRVVGADRGREVRAA